MEVISSTLEHGFESGSARGPTPAAKTKSKPEPAQADRSDEASKPAEKPRKRTSVEVRDQASAPSPPNRAITFKLNRETERFFIQVVDRNTGEIIRQIPPEDMLKLAEELDASTGHLFNTSA